MKEQKQAQNTVFSIDIKKIRTNPNQPRKDFCEESIIKLASSINQFGIMQPLTVRESGEGFELIAGERRLRAAKELGLSTVPCIIAVASEQESAEMAIIENLLREDLNIFEEAEAIATLIDTYSLTQEQIAKRLCVSQSYIANKLRLLRLSKDEKAKITTHKLTERHARALLRILNSTEREKALETIITNNLNVSQAEELVEKILAGKEQTTSKKRSFKSIGAFYEALSRAISAVEESGFKIKSRKIENDNYTELTIIIPKELGSKPSTEMQLLT